MFNNVSIVGRFVADPELKTTATGKMCCSFTLASERDIPPDENGKRKTDFIDFISWDEKAQFIAANFNKGQSALVTGRIQSNSWTDKNDVKRKSIEIEVNKIYFFGKKEKPEAESERDLLACDYFEEIESSDLFPM